jgi:ComF family protein
VDLLRRFASILDLIVPPTCAACGLAGEAICAQCRDGIAAVEAVGCRRCGHPWAVMTATCSECPSRLDRLRFAAGYGESMRALFTGLKDEGRRDVASVLAELVLARCDRPPDAAVLVPVPLTPERRAKRGFNQTELISRTLAESWGLQVAHLLERTRDDPPQRGASKTDRARNVRGAFAVRAGATVPTEAWIVDDVCTTGATLSACALALRRGGVGWVGAVCVARVVRQP